jgi:hypothetical protein
MDEVKNDFPISSSIAFHTRDFGSFPIPRYLLQSRCAGAIGGRTVSLRGEDAQRET